jgi:uncharacterized protein YehS (DUF1456 family)
MSNNDILKSLRYTLNAKDKTMVEIFALAGYAIEEYTLIAIMRKDDDAAYVECRDEQLRLFLDGLIIYKRGKRENAEPTGKYPADALSNNEILKKLRIAFELKSEDIVAMLKAVEFDISMSEVNALFRKPGHKNYVVCQNQLLRNFLRALPKSTKGAS